MEVIQKTVYRVSFKGSDVGIAPFPSLAEAQGYIEGGVRAGNSHEDYVIDMKHVVIISGEWQETGR